MTSHGTFRFFLSASTTFKGIFVEPAVLAKRDLPTDSVRKNSISFGTR